jgi:hypothetical protein
MKKIILFGVLSLFIFLSNISIASAANSICTCNGLAQFTVTKCADCPGKCSDPTSGKGQKTCVESTPTNSSAPTTVSIPNPLGTTDVSQVVATLINFVLSLVGSISLLLFIYGGITWMTSAGAPAQVKKGKDIVIWAIIGLAVVFTSYIMVKFVIQGLTFGG